MVAGQFTAKHLPLPAACKATGPTLILTPIQNPEPQAEVVDAPPQPNPAVASINKIGKRLKRLYYVHMNCALCPQPLDIAVITSSESIQTFETLLTKDFKFVCPLCEKRNG